ncbi:DUF4249 domain-containing protein [Bacteroidota bacterium]
MNLKKITYVFSLFLIWGCMEVIELDIEQVPPVYLVEGIVTNRYQHHLVRLSKSIGFYEEGPSPGVSGALISVLDNLGNEYPYTESDSAGIYLSNEIFEGVPGRAYTLNIDVDGQHFTAKDSLRSIQEIETLLWRFSLQKLRWEDGIDDPADQGYLYEVLLTTTEPQETKDYYLFKVYRNDTLQTADGQSIYYADDAVVGEKIEDFPGPAYYRYLDTAIFEVYSMTPEAFKFWNDMQANIANDGGMFSSVPANAHSNIQGDRVLGFFQVSSVVADSLVVGDSTRMHPDSPPYPL